MNQNLRLYIVSYKDGSQKFFENKRDAQYEFEYGPNADNAMRIVSLYHECTLLRILSLFDETTSALILGAVIEDKDSSVVWKKEK